MERATRSEVWSERVSKGAKKRARASEGELEREHRERERVKTIRDG